MKATKVMQAVLVAAVALAGASVKAQGGDTSEVSASSTPGEKEVRAANRALRKAVLRSLSRTAGLDVGRVVVVAKGGSILLEGYVPERSQIDLAASAAQAVPGVTSVTNRLIVRSKGL
jgi:hyperosmotically inducible periplasmic protein